MKERECMEDLGVYGSIILKLKWNLRAWTLLM
jgi:hypothetical protein